VVVVVVVVAAVVWISKTGPWLSLWLCSGAADEFDGDGIVINSAPAPPTACIVDA